VFKSSDTEALSDNHNSYDVKPEAESDVSVTCVVIDSSHFVAHQFRNFLSGVPFSFACKRPLDSFPSPEAVRSVLLCLLVDVVRTERERLEVVEDS